MRVAVLVNGPPGSGKSALAGPLAECLRLPRPARMDLPALLASVRAAVA